MTINSITLHNFRQYKDSHKIEFATDPNRNVTLILGENTGGKTTIVQAFHWCLYDVTPNFKDKDIFNKELVRGMRGGDTLEVRVDIQLMYRSVQYNITRRQSMVYGSKPKISRINIEYVDSDGQSKEILTDSSISGTINDILPQELSEYFFLAGEYINTINETKNAKRAIEGLMGITSISNAIEHFRPTLNKSVISQLKAELDTGANTNSVFLNKQLQDCKDKHSNISLQLQDQKTEQDRLQDLIEGVDTQLKNHQNIKLLQQNREQLEKEIKELEQQAIDWDKRIVKDFSNQAFKYFAGSLYAKANDILSNAKDDTLGIPEMHSKSIEYILQRGVCICGCDLSDDKCRTYIERERRNLPPESIGTLLRNFGTRCTEYAQVVDTYRDNIKQDYVAIIQTKDSIADKQERLKQISNQLQDNDVDISKLERDRQEYKSSLARCIHLQNEYNRLIGQLTTEISNTQTKIDSLVVTSDKNKKIKKYIAYAEHIYNWLIESHDNVKNNVKRDVDKAIKDIFDKMYHGKRHLEIDDKYRIKLYNIDSTGTYLTETSSGLDVVKNFAFVAGIVKVARSIASDTANQVNVVEPYPLVMDAPFSNVDATHIANITSMLPDITEQLIVIVMCKDWQHAKATLQNKVGKAYNIVKTSDTISSIQQGDINV
jgi:DNA sulfur modification protein DndD